MKRFLCSCLLAGACLIVGACTLIPVEKRDDPSLILPRHFSGDQMAEDAHPVWQKSFSDASLSADVQRLQTDNLEIAAARARVDQALAEYGIVRSRLLPALDAHAQFDRTREKEDVAGSSATTANTVTLGAALSWEADLWGRLTHRRVAAELDLQAKQALADQVAMERLRLLVKSWVTHQAARRLQQVLSEQQETNARLLELAEMRLAQGQGSALDVLQQQGLLAAARRTMPAAIATARHSANAYALLLGHLPGAADPTRAFWPELLPMTGLPGPQALLARRPDLKAAFLALQAADRQVAAAIADRLPRVSIDLTAEVSGNRLGAMGDGSLVRLASGLLAPIFDAGRLKAEVARNRAVVVERLALLRQALLAAVGQVEDALVAERALFAEQDLLTTEVAIADETVRQAGVQYLNGQTSFVSVLLARVTIQRLQQRQILLQQELLINRSRLLAALGAPWSTQP